MEQETTNCTNEGIAQLFDFDIDDPRIPQIVEALTELEQPAEQASLAYRRAVRPATLPEDGSEPRDSEAFDRALDYLPYHNVQQARDVFLYMATSTDPIDRLNAGHAINVLTRVDHEVGFDLWQRLVSDPDEEVRRWTVERITEDALSQLDEDAVLEARLREHGLSWRDTALLLHQYVHVVHWDEPADSARKEPWRDGIKFGDFSNEPPEPGEFDGESETTGE